MAEGEIKCKQDMEEEGHQGCVLPGRTIIYIYIASYISQIQGRNVSGAGCLLFTLDYAFACT